MSQAGRFSAGGGGAGDLNTLTGNAGGAVGPDGSNNINVVGDGVTVTVTGNPGTNTLTIAVAESNLLDFDTDAGTATPVANTITIAGGTGIDTSGAGSTVTVNLTTPVSVANGGTGDTSLTAYAVLCGGTISTNPVQSIASVGNSGQVLTSNGAGNLPTFQAPAASGYAWSVVAGAAQTLVTLNGYFANNGGQVAFALPVVAAVGDTFMVAGMNNATGWKVTQSAGQQIHFGNQNTTLGATGALTSTSTYDVVQFVCNVANNEFVVTQAIGNITVTQESYGY